jgi:tRNA nucleotidyltransferase/poly(A) polymerase
MARFEAAMDLRPAAGLHEAARATREGLSAVSAERVHVELSRLFELPRAARGVAILRACGLLEPALPGWRRVAAGTRPWEEVEALRQRALESSPDPPGAQLGFALLLDVDPLGSKFAQGEELARALRLSAAQREGCLFLWRARRECEPLALRSDAVADRILLLREPLGVQALGLARAWAVARQAEESVAALDAMSAWFTQLAPDRVRPAPWVTVTDLEAAGVPRGPRWGELLRAAERLQLDGVHADREQALEWLRARSRVGGDD